MKMAMFFVPVAFLATAIALYFILSKKDRKVIVNKKSKKFTLTFIAVFIIMFIAAVAASMFSFKLF